ncbi:MAG: flagellar biosynthesis protein FliQ [Burkholderiaceae bacterium]|jgi:flagellar biosynthetic protein FliQ|nr:MAG: flagellar biosynthesis protein FliQ [Burkholderiaceae bacterium]
MDAQQAFTTGQEALGLMLAISAPLLLTILVVGLIISIIQAATQIHESTLSFVPKMVAAVAVLVLGGHWMMTTLIEYIQRLLQSIPGMVS